MISVPFFIGADLLGYLVRILECGMPKLSLAMVAGLGLAVGLSACASYDSYPDGSGQSISIPYDPYDYDPADLLAEAQAHCEAYGMNARYTDETIDPHAVRWRYRHFDCI